MDLKFLLFNQFAQQSLSSHCSLKFLFKCSIRLINMESNKESDSRGALIVLEGLDQELGHSIESWKFPDRNTGNGQIISSYLANNSHLDDHAIHLLFSANHWEKRSLMESKLRSRTVLIVDRYSFSGALEAGLLAPDLVIYLEISPEKEAERGGYGGERYEQHEFQKKSCSIVDAKLPIKDVEKQLKQIDVKKGNLFGACGIISDLPIGGVS
ncbi:hypothetical protein Pfo_030284 [Paulownia fortunei]|nr:hypothetical protein Pfo_030284 [Paulownia fortunei]